MTKPRTRIAQVLHQLTVNSCRVVSETGRRGREAYMPSKVLFSLLGHLGALSRRRRTSGDDGLLKDWFIGDYSSPLVT